MLEPGCYADGSRALSDIYEIIFHLAESYGYKGEYPEGEFDHEIADEIIDWMNDEIPGRPNCTYWGFGENAEGFGLWYSHEYEEKVCSNCCCLTLWLVARATAMRSFSSFGRSKDYR